MPKLRELARAKVNLSLHVLGRRSDGYHELESLVAFADCADDLTITPGPALSLNIDGETAAEAGPIAANLVLKASRHLAEHIPGLQTGAFQLTKRLPVAAGLGGGSADAAAALRLLARLNQLAPGDDRLLAAARLTGADCSVCLYSGPAFMRGTGEHIEPLQDWPSLHAVLVNPGVAVPTRPVFDALAMTPGRIELDRAHPALDRAPLAAIGNARNDLAPPARRIAPVIVDAEAALAGNGATLVRMSGSGATVFGLFPDPTHAAHAASELAAGHPNWWVRSTTLGGSPPP